MPIAISVQPPEKAGEGESQAPKAMSHKLRTSSQAVRHCSVGEAVPEAANARCVAEEGPAGGLTTTSSSSSEPTTGTVAAISNSQNEESLLFPAKGATQSSCLKCSFTPTAIAILFEGFQILVYACPCGEDHAHPSTVLNHHARFLSCMAALSASARFARPCLSRMYPPNASSTRDVDFIRWPALEPDVHQVDYSDNDNGAGQSLTPESPDYAEAQRASPDVCITCNTPFSVRVQIFKNRGFETPFNLFRCKCGERFSREYPNMRVRVEIGTKEAAQALERDIVVAKEQVKRQYASHEAGEGRKRLRRVLGPWVLGKGVGQEEKGTAQYRPRDDLQKKWAEHIAGSGITRERKKVMVEFERGLAAVKGREEY